MLSSANRRACSHGSSRAPAETVLAIRFHCSGELSTQNRAIWVWSASARARRGDAVAAEALTSLRSAAYFLLVTGYGGPGRNWELSSSTNGVTSPQSGRERERRAGREAVLAGRGALREVLDRPVACRSRRRPSGRGWRRPRPGRPRCRAPWPTIRDRGERGGVVGLDARDAGVDAGRREGSRELAAGAGRARRARPRQQRRPATLRASARASNAYGRERRSMALRASWMATCVIA